ncbi:MAG: hypothetical protein JW902_09900 [Syntrophaceae bacterium]|nr:hypothetical protein [Syntrophaceae bacterium]
MKKLMGLILFILFCLLPSMLLAAMPSPSDNVNELKMPRRVGPVTIPLYSVSVFEPSSTQSPYTPGWPLIVKWKYVGTPPGLAKVILMKGTQEAQVFTPGTSWGKSGLGSFATTMPANEYGLNLYTVKVVSTTKSTYAGTSGQFMSMPVLKVTSPTNDGQTWKVGETRTINWRYSAGCGSTVSIKAILTNNQWSYDLKPNYPIGSYLYGAFPWTIPASIPAGEYRIYLKSSNAACNDRTAIFKIIH